MYYSGRIIKSINSESDLQKKCVACYEMDDATNSTILLDAKKNLNGIIDPTGLTYRLTGLQNYCVQQIGNNIIQLKSGNIGIIGNNGINDYPFTINIWVKYTNTNYNNQWLFDFEGACRLEAYANNLDFILIDNGSNYIHKNIPIASLGLNTTSWFMITATYNGNRSYTGLNIYLNGQLLATSGGINGTYNFANNLTPYCAIGGTAVGAVDFYKFLGLIDQTSFFNTNLSLNEINRLYNNGLGVKYSKF